MRKKLAVQLILSVLALATGGAALGAMMLGLTPHAYVPIVSSSSATPPAVPTALATITPAQPTPTTEPSHAPETISGLAVLGDSTQDEYQADNPRGAGYNHTTLNWVEQLAAAQRINLGPLGTYAEPRRSGYAFNWARSGATSDQMISSGQHTGAAKQALDGEISHAVIQIGINDFYFSGLGLEIYKGTISGDALAARLDHIADNIITAAQTLHATGRCQVLVAATQDYITLPIVPEIYTTYQDLAGRQGFVNALAYLNQHLAARSEQAGIAFFDFNALYLAEVQSRLNPNGFLVVGGEQIDLRNRGNEPHFGILDDGYVHPGTVLSGLYANVYIKAMNQTFHTAIVPLSDQEILQAAGIKP